MTTLGRAYEKLGTCALCYADGEALYRRMINGRRVALAPFVCKSCFERIEANLVKSHCPTCHVEKESGSPLCKFCRTMRITPGGSS